MKKLLFSLFFSLFINLNSKADQENDLNIKGKCCDWNNWAGQKCSPKKIFYPNNLEEIKEIIAHASSQNIPVRFYGTGHSINDLVCTNGYLVNTDNFNKILAIDKKNQTVRVEGGMKLKHFFKELAKEGMALENQGFIKEQSIAGALATGTHGTGKTGTLSDFIVSIEIIDGLGRYQVISNNENSQWLQAARIHLGAFGFVYAVTLKCVPLFVLKHKRKMHKWSEVLKNFDSYYENNDYFMLMAHPVSDNVLVYTWNKTEEPPTNNFFIRLSERLLMNEVSNYLTIKAAHWAPGITNEFISLLFKAMEQKEHREYSYKTLSPIKNPHEVQDYLEEEIAIPVIYFKDAISDVFTLYNEYKKRDFELVGFLTCRFVKSSNKALLSPTYNQDCVYISLITLSCFKEYKNFYTEFEKLMSKYQFSRPHWGKLNFLTKEQVANLYGNNFIEFNKIRDELDPKGIFLNSYLIERFVN